VSDMRIEMLVPTVKRIEIYYDTKEHAGYIGGKRFTKKQIEAIKDFVKLVGGQVIESYD